MISARDIIIDTPTPPVAALLANNAPIDEVNAIFRRLRELHATMSENENRHTCVNILISACIDEGIDTGKRITGAIGRLGFSKKHAGIILKDGTGTRWKADALGKYSNLV